MKSIVKSLPFRLLVGVVVGIALGLWAGGASFGSQVMQVVLTIKELLGSIINFCVPLIIIGFIAPSITRLKQNASRMLLLALVLAYGSSVLAALLSMSAGFAIIPALSIQSAAEGLNELPELLFNLEIAPIMSVMSALVFSVLVGLAATWAKAEVITKVLEEFQRVVLEMVVRVVIPILPFFIAGTFCGLAYEGSITRQLPVFLIVILIVMVGHYIWMAVLYGAAGLYSGSNPLEVVRHYGPAYITAVGTMSSAATLAVLYRRHRRGVLSGPGEPGAVRRRRIAAGSGRSVQEVNQLIKQWGEMNKMMGKMRGMMSAGNSKKARRSMGNMMRNMGMGGRGW